MCVCPPGMVHKMDDEMCQGQSSCFISVTIIGLKVG